MQLAVRSRIIGALAVAIMAAALTPGTSVAYRLTHHEAAQLAQRSTPDPGSTTQTAAASPVVLPNPDQQTQQVSPVGPPILWPARGSEIAAINRAKAQQRAALSYSPPATARYSSAVMNAFTSTARPVAVSAPTVKAPSDGFDYGDAAIGAAIAAAIAALASGTVAVRRRSQPQHS